MRVVCSQCEAPIEFLEFAEAVRDTETAHQAYCVSPSGAREVALDKFRKRQERERSALIALREVLLQRLYIGGDNLDAAPTVSNMENPGA